MASDGRNLAVDGLPNDDDDDEADLNTANGYANDDGLQDMASFPLEDEGDLSPAIDHQDGRNDLDAAAMQQSPDGGRADNAGNLIVGLNEDVYDGDVEDMEHESSSDYTSDELSTGDMDEMDASFHVGGGRVANPDARDGQRDQADEGDDQAGTKAVACVYCLVDDADKEVVFVDLKLPCRHWGTCPFSYHCLTFHHLAEAICRCPARSIGPDTHVRCCKTSIHGLSARAHLDAFARLPCHICHIPNENCLLMR